MGSLAFGFLLRAFSAYDLNDTAFLGRWPRLSHVLSPDTSLSSLQTRPLPTVLTTMVHRASREHPAIKAPKTIYDLRLRH
jgi:hypothetical protein